MTQNTKKSILIGAGVLAVIILGITMIVDPLMRLSNLAKPGGQKPSANNSNTTNQAPPLPQVLTPSFPPLPPEESPVYTYSGTVADVSINSKNLILQTARGPKTVLWSDSTSILVRRELTPEEQFDVARGIISLDKFESQTSVTTLTSGITIMATSATDIKALSEFTASKITIIK